MCTCLSLSYAFPQTDLEEERIKQKIADRTRKERCRIYLIRLILNLFVIGVLAGCFYSIYVATSFSQQAQMSNVKVMKSAFCCNRAIYLPLMSFIINFLFCFTQTLFKLSAFFRSSWLLNVGFLFWGKVLSDLGKMKIPRYYFCCFAGQFL